MPIKSYSGKPGNGKTALMVERLLAEAKKKDPRPLFYSGVDDLQEGLATQIANPRSWNDIDPNGPAECTCDALSYPHCHVLRNGSIWFVDEAWKWFGHLHDATRQATPSHVLALAEHRHRGIDMVWTFQGPNQIYPFARPLMDEHHHCVRRFGTQIIDVFKWEELQEDVKSTTKREIARRETRALPKATFGLYKSADAHTIKAKLPKRLFVLPLLFIGFACAVWFAYQTLKPAARTSAVASLAEGPGAAPAATAPPPLGERNQSPRFASVEDYIAQHMPRIATMPHSAPVFDDREVTVDRELFCILGHAGEDANGEQQAESCHCLTEQGTPYELTDKECRMVARQGAPYNPYKRNQREEAERGAGGRPPAAMDASAAASSPGTVIEAEQVSGYGDIEVVAAGAAPG